MEPKHNGTPAADQNQGANAPRSPQPFHNEPLTDFARAENRERMVAAIKRVREQFGRTYPVVIDNAPQPVGKTLDSVNPSRSAEVVGKVAMAVRCARQCAYLALPAGLQGTYNSASLLPRCSDHGDQLFILG